MKKLLASLLLVALPLTACSSIPKDTEGALKTATGNVLIVGASEHKPFIDVRDSGTVTGTEAVLIMGYARSINAQVRWVTGSEEQLAERISDNELDIIVGGLTKDSPWTDKFAMTRPYQKDAEVNGKHSDLVMGVPLGENALLVSLERYLAEQNGEIK